LADFFSAKAGAQTRMFERLADARLGDDQRWQTRPCAALSISRELIRHMVEKRAKQDRPPNGILAETVNAR